MTYQLMTDNYMLSENPDDSLSNKLNAFHHSLQFYLTWYFLLKHNYNKTRRENNFIVMVIFNELQL